ncbi:MAG: OmpA/MotB family protein [Bacteroidia bacterium]|jgi:chemotaxis protein MotB
MPESKNQKLKKSASELPPDNPDAWQATFLDTVTLLLTFFILIAASSDPRFNAMMSSADVSTFDSAAQPISFPIQTLKISLERALHEEIQDKKVLLDAQKYEIRTMINGASLYASGGTELLPGGRGIVERIIRQVRQMSPVDFKVDVEGHTDSAPIKNFRFADNWDLSVARASGVVRLFIESGFAPENLKASGFGDARALVDDRDAHQKLLPQKQDINRRIVIRLYYD